VSFDYSSEVRALSNVSLYIKEGEVVGIMGRNGAGKSTLIQLINGLLYPTKGKIFVDGLSTEDYNSNKLIQKIGIMFQNPEHQLFSSTVEEELNFSLKNLPIDSDQRLANKLEIIEEFGLKHLLNKSPWNCSGGERKKISIACILCRKPDVIIFDEPTLGQDKYGYAMLEEVLEKAKKRNQIIIVVTHNTEFAFQHLDRIIVLDRGKFLADGPTKKILTNTLIQNNSALVEPHFYKIIRDLAKDSSLSKATLQLISDAKSFEELDTIITNHLMKEDVQ
jgi:energy-coupling factor transporter ATP-binding protein EcfA2